MTGTGGPPAIWVFAECRDGKVVGPVLDLVAETRRLTDQIDSEVTAIVIGDADVAADLGARGAAALVLVPDVGWDGADGAVPAAVLSALAREHRPATMLFSGTALGRDVAPRVAIRMGTGVVGDCTYLRVSTDGRLEATRSLDDGGAAARTAWSDAGPSIAVVPIGILPPSAPADLPAAAVVVEAVDGLPDGGPRLLDSYRIDPAKLPLEDVGVIVAGGLGIGGPDGFEILADLADAMGGKVAASRRATDLGWAGTESLVGQTGKTVAPGVYLALGISGASQHVLGMQDSGLIVSINTDPHAPMHAVADIAVVGDARSLAPVLAEAFRAALSEDGGP